MVDANILAPSGSVKGNSRNSAKDGEEIGDNKNMAPISEIGKQTRISASLYWFFTWNNYPEESIRPFIEQLDAHCSLYACEREVGDKCGTPHIQGKIKLTKKGRPLELFKSFKIHWEKSKMWKGHEYCFKDSNTEDMLNNCWYKGFEPVIAPKIYGWQQELVDRIPHMKERKIYWYWEPNGNVGKTDLCRYLCINWKYKALMVGGRSTDMKCAIAATDPKPKIVIVNIVRGGTVSYPGLEAVSDGIFFSSKYESGMVCFNKPKVIVFSNEEPDYDQWSKDRYEVTKIRVDDNVHNAESQ